MIKTFPQESKHLMWKTVMAVWFKCLCSDSVLDHVDDRVSAENVWLVSDQLPSSPFTLSCLRKGACSWSWVYITVGMSISCCLYSSVKLNFMELSAQGKEGHRHRVTMGPDCLQHSLRGIINLQIDPRSVHEPWINPGLHLHVTCYFRFNKEPK